MGRGRRPSATSFAALRPGEPFFFKLKAPHNAIGGFGQFLRAEKLPVWRAWDVFGEANGVADEFALPRLVAPRLGQGSFRLAVLDAYGGQCAVTTEHSLPVVEAAHIRPWSQGGRHELSNGLPLRRDLHRLFDLGFVTVRPDLTFAVSPRLREDWENGRVYYELEGRAVQRPSTADAHPSAEALEWHRDEVFRAR